MISAALGFIGIFLTTNFIIFLSYYISNFRDQKGIFLFFKSHVKSKRDKIKSLYARKESDPFRINFDLVLIFFLILLFPALGQSFWFYLLSISILIFGFIYVIYISIILFVFKRIPDIKSDLALTKVGLMVSKEKALLIWFSVFITLALIVGLSYFFINSMAHLVITMDYNTRICSLIFLSFFLAPGIFHFMSYGYEIRHHRTVFSPLMHFYENIQFGKRYQSVLEKDEGFFESLNQYKNHSLKQKPNIIFIAIESYGSILFNKDFDNEIKSKLEKISNTLSRSGWHSKSKMSEPPIFAGGSWLSYSSFLYGIDIHDISLYNLLFQNHKAFQKFDSILHFTKKSGYKNYLLCPIGGYDGKIDWKMINQAYQSDHCFTFENIGYTGKTMSYITFGRTPPDEYSLHYAYDEIEKSPDPFTLFFSTLNSHCFFDSPINTEKSWKDYNHKDFQTTGSSKENLKLKYLKAIDYQLDFIQKFLLEKNPENTIVVLFGDHQPPFITKESDGKNTPIHIISKNKNFVEAWKANGFEEGLWINDLDQNMKHQGFYSLFMKYFLQQYGEQDTAYLKYEPDGITLN